MHTLESPLGNEYLNSTLFPIMPSPSDLPRQLDNGSHFEPANSLPYSSQPELSGTTPQNRLQANPNLRRSFTMASGTNPAGNSNTFRQSTLGLPASKSKRNSGIGVASSPGRLFKVLADFFLLSGRTEDATIWCVERGSLSLGAFYLMLSGIPRRLFYSSLRKMLLGTLQH